MGRLVHRSAIMAVVVAATPGGAASAWASGTQVFKLGATIECAKAVASLASPGSSRMHVSYSECTSSGEAVTVSRAEYTISEAGTLAVDNTFTFAGLLFGCKISVGPVGNEALSTVSYVNKGGVIAYDLALTNITYTTSGGLFCAGGSSGTYTGELEP